MSLSVGSEYNLVLSVPLLICIKSKNGTGYEYILLVNFIIECTVFK